MVTFTECIYGVVCVQLQLHGGDSGGAERPLGAEDVHGLWHGGVVVE